MPDYLVIVIGVVYSLTLVLMYMFIAISASINFSKLFEKYTNADGEDLTLREAEKIPYAKGVRDMSLVLAGITICILVLVFIFVYFLKLLFVNMGL